MPALGKAEGTPFRPGSAAGAGIGPGGPGGGGYYPTPPGYEVAYADTVQWLHNGSDDGTETEDLLVDRVCHACTSWMYPSVMAARTRTTSALESSGKADGC